MNVALLTSDEGVARFAPDMGGPPAAADQTPTRLRVKPVAAWLVREPDPWADKTVAAVDSIGFVVTRVDAALAEIVVVELRRNSDVLGDPGDGAGGLVSPRPAHLITTSGPAGFRRLVSRETCPLPICWIGVRRVTETTADRPAQECRMRDRAAW